MKTNEIAGQDSLKILYGLECVRRRPRMFVGDTEDGSGLHQLLWNAVANVVDLHRARHATQLNVCLTPDNWITVSDNGPGISVEPARYKSASVLETICMNLHAGAPSAYGLAVTNALSTHLEVTTTRDGMRWRQAFERGTVVSELFCLGSTSSVGTTISFHPDPDIFGTTKIDPETVAYRLQKVKWLSPLLQISFQGRAISPTPWLARVRNG